MENSSEYRERPFTGTVSEVSSPEFVDPKVLTDDRGNADLLVFERSWGHRLLAGVGFAMLVVGLILCIYCAVQLFNLSSWAGDVESIMTLGYVMYGVGLVAGIVIIPPALVGIYVAKHPEYSGVSIGLAIFGLVLVGAFVVYALAIGTSNVISVVLYALLFAVLPVLYLVASLKIRKK